MHSENTALCIVDILQTVQCLLSLKFDGNLLQRGPRGMNKVNTIEFMFWAHTCILQTKSLLLHVCQHSLHCNRDTLQIRFQNSAWLWREISATAGTDRQNIKVDYFFGTTWAYIVLCTAYLCSFQNNPHPEFSPNAYSIAHMHTFVYTVFGIT